MTQPQQNRLTMNKALVQHLEANKPVWQNLRVFVSAYEELLASVAGRDTAQQAQATTTTGITEDKEADTEMAVSKVLALASNASVYALDKRDHDLFASLNYGHHYLVNLPDNEQGAFLQNMLGRVQGVVGNLGDYNVTNADILDAQAAVDKVKAELTDPRAAIDIKAAATKTIPAFEADSRHAIARMDRMIHNFSAANPEFVQVYRQARIIVDAGKRHRRSNNGAAGTPGAV